MRYIYVSIPEKQEVCNAEQLKARCPEDSAIVIKSAVYGRMKLGRCLEVDAGYLGCQNDVLWLADRWCSGRQLCDVYVPNDELKQANDDCQLRGFSLFLEVEYHCVRSKLLNERSTPLYINITYSLTRSNNPPTLSLHSLTHSISFLLCVIVCVCMCERVFRCYKR